MMQVERAALGSLELAEIALAQFHSTDGILLGLVAPNLQSKELLTWSGPVGL
jgi:hypothetical protein